MYRPSSNDTIDMPTNPSARKDDETEETTEPIEGSTAAAPIDTPSIVTAIAEPTAPEEAVAPITGHAGSLIDFKHELVRAMRSAADVERERMEATVATATETHLQKVRIRAAAEADELRHLAEGDVDGIHAWSKTEIARIQEEADRRIGARRQQLERHVEQHATITDREVGTIERAVTEYRAELDRYFARMSNEQDPGELARLAGLLPPPPDLERIGGDARAEAVDAYARQPAQPDPADDRTSAFSPTEPGPGLVAVMGESDDEAVPAGGLDESAESNGAFSRLRSLAGRGSPPRKQD
jgi:F0F1-type ATP synthase membrane subunit b/b'